MKRLMIIALAVVLLLLMLPAAAVSASPPTTASGEFSLTSFGVTKSIITTNGNMILWVTLTTEWTGDFVGTDEGVGVFVVRPNGDYKFHTFSTWTGSYLGGPIGTMKHRVSNKGNDFTGVFQGKMTILGGSGSLADIHGVLTITGPPSTYSGTIHFDP